MLCRSDAASPGDCDAVARWRPHNRPPAAFVKPELLALAGLLKKGRGLLMAHALIDAQDQPRALVAEAATEVLVTSARATNPRLSSRAIVHRSGSRDVTESLLATAQLWRRRLKAELRC